MIVQCEVCQTKYNVEDSKIGPEGVKVRCSKCKHIFPVNPPPPPPPPPPPEGEDFLQDLESFEKFHKELMDTPGLETEPSTDEESLTDRGIAETTDRDMGWTPPPEGPSTAELPTEEWPGLSFEEGGPTEPIEEELEAPTFDMRGLEKKEYFERPRVRPKRRKTSWTFVLIGILITVALGGYYLWSERGMELSIPGNIPHLLRSIPEKLQSLWEGIRGIERGSLSFSDLEDYKDTIGKDPVFVITGKVVNDTNKTKKHIKIRVILLNDKNKVLDEKHTLCGSYFSKEDLKKLPPRFARGDFNIRPMPSQMRVKPHMSVPFIVIFPDMPPDANEYQVEIVEAPNA